MHIHTHTLMTTTEEHMWSDRVQEIDLSDRNYYGTGTGCELANLLDNGHRRCLDPAVVFLLSLSLEKRTLLLTSPHQWDATFDGC